MRGGLDRAQVKFLRDKVGRVAFLGGSIAAMDGWRVLVCEELKRRFPTTKFDFVNAGISSLGTVPGAFRFKRDLLVRGPVDLLFVEAAVNDSSNDTPTRDQLRAMEGIVRHARLANPAAEIARLYFVDPEKMKDIRAGRRPEVIVNQSLVLIDLAFTQTQTS